MCKNELISSRIKRKIPGIIKSFRLGLTEFLYVGFFDSLQEIIQQQAQIIKQQELKTIVELLLGRIGT
jgi:hypothetical protein